MHDAIYVAISLDVEEEGLFCGKYATANPPTCNLDRLRKLNSFISRGVKPTLFCAYSALASESGSAELARLASEAEIGSHLHHWNTPPLSREAEDAPFLTAVPAHALSNELFEAKLRHTQAAAARLCGHAPVSFRMGRWDMHRRFFPILAKNGIKVDASVRPLHIGARSCKSCGYTPNHFAAPADPYLIATEHGEILEAPLTVTPIANFLKKLPVQLQAGLHHWGALALLPVEHPLWLMRLTTDLHLKRGGRTISLTWHSSEMLPGGNPKMPTRQAVDAFLAKIARYLDWLESRYNVVYATMGELRHLTAACSHTGENVDWTCGARKEIRQKCGGQCHA